MKEKKQKFVHPAHPATEIDYQNFEKEAIARLYAGDELIGENGILSGMIQRIVNAALHGEMTHHLKSDRQEGVENRRNGHTSKTISTKVGPVSISPPRDRNGTFQPELVGKWNRHVGSGFDEQILSMYGHGNSYSDIQTQLKKFYGVDFSMGALSEVTERVWTELEQWQAKALLPFYAVVFLDGMYFMTRENGRAAKKVLYMVYGIDAQGVRDVLGIYIREEEGAREWGRIAEDLKKRGVQDILFTCVDGLSGFVDAINNVFPKTVIQRCIVHMIRSSTKLVSDKDIKKVCADLRLIYTAADEPQARMHLDAFKEKWDKQYPEVSRAWDKVWGDLTPFLDYSEPVRRMIYTTNGVEGLNRQVRKVTKTKGSWANDKALLKQVYATLFYGKMGWKRKVFQWNVIQRELTEIYGDRYSQWVV
jgi:putative transposase